MVRGEDFVLTLTDRDAVSKLPVDSTGYTAQLIARPEDDSSQDIVDLVSEITFGGEDGQVRILIPHTTSYPLGRYEYDLRVVDSDDKVAFLVGGFLEVSNHVADSQAKELFVDQGEDAAFTFFCVDGKTGDPVDQNQFLNGTLIVTLRDEVIDTFSDGEVSFASGGKVLVDITADSTQDWVPERYEYFLSVLLAPGGLNRRKMISTGFMTVSPVTTHA